jgi:uracil-DNA glycosylase
VSASTRLLYLERMGIDAWVPRQQQVRAEAGPATVPAAQGAPRAASEWEALAAEVAACRRCALRDGCSQTVFGVGDRQAKLLVVGEGPGAEEDRLGEPFVGRAGALLNNMLRAIENPRERVFIANIVKCRPPSNRDPLPEEVAACLPYLHRLIALLAPRAVLALGRVAAHNLLETDQPLGTLRGMVHPLGTSGIPVVVTYHPAYLLRSPAEKAKAWDDLKRVRGILGDVAP